MIVCQDPRTKEGVPKRSDCFTNPGGIPGGFESEKEPRRVCGNSRDVADVGCRLVKLNRKTRARSHSP